MGLNLTLPSTLIWLALLSAVAHVHVEAKSAAPRSIFANGKRPGGGGGGRGGGDGRDRRPLEACADSSTWHEKGKPLETRGCPYISALSASRCDKMGADGTPASTGCPVSRSAYLAAVDEAMPPPHACCRAHMPFPQPQPSATRSRVARATTTSHLHTSPRILQVRPPCPAHCGVCCQRQRRPSQRQQRRPAARPCRRRPSRQRCPRKSRRCSVSGDIYCRLRRRSRRRSQRRCCRRRPRRCRP